MGAVERRIPDLASATLDEMEAAWQAAKVDPTADGAATRRENAP